MKRKKRSIPAIHICRFVGRRTDEKLPKRTRCDLCRSEDNKSVRGTVVIIYAWGAAALCEKHAREEEA